MATLPVVLGLEELHPCLWGLISTCITGFCEELYLKSYEIVESIVGCYISNIIAICVVWLSLNAWNNLMLIKLFETVENQVIFSHLQWQADKFYDNGVVCHASL